MTTHDLKIWPEFFQAVIEGRKTFEFRSTVDRTFAVGDELRLREFDQTTKSYTGRECEATITYILDKSFELEDTAILAIKVQTITNWNVIDSEVCPNCPTPNDANCQNCPKHQDQIGPDVRTSGGLK